MTGFQLAGYENRPFFERALRYGVKNGLIDEAKLDTIAADAPKGMVQIATAFGSPYLRAELELAKDRMVQLISLYLFESSAGDLGQAARLIRDNTILALSRGGSNLIKELFALPEYAILGKFEHGRVDDFLEFWSRRKTIADYRAARTEREQNQAKIRLARKLGKGLGVTDVIAQEQHCEADALIRTALLTAIAGAPQSLGMNMLGFAEILAQLRKKAPTKPGILTGDFSAEEIELLEAVHSHMDSNDRPLINDTDLPLDALIGKLSGRYFILEQDEHDVARYDALVSKEWSKYTKGKSDIDAIFTVLLCIAAGMPGKNSLTESGAKTLVKKVRKDGFQPELANQFIELHAPHEKQESLLEDWAEFCEQAQLYLLDDWDHDLHLAMRFLHDNCYIEKASKKSVKQKTRS